MVVDIPSHFDADPESAHYIRGSTEDHRSTARFGRQAQTVVGPAGFRRRSDGGDAGRPRATLELDWAHGFDGRRAKSLVWVGAEEFAYPLAKLVVLQRLQPSYQRYFRGHSGPVSCLAYCQATNLCASGQLQGKDPSAAPFVCIWSPFDCGLVTTLAYHQARILGVAFSADGERVFSLGGSEEAGHTLAVWTGFVPTILARYDKDGVLPMVLREPTLALAAGGVPGFALTASPTNGHKNGDWLASYDAGLGDQQGGHLYFWSILPAGSQRSAAAASRSRNSNVEAASGCRLDGKRAMGVFNNTVGLRPRRVHHVAWGAAPGRSYVCGDNGIFYIFDRAAAIAQVQVCSGPLGASCEVPGVGLVLFSGGGSESILYLAGLDMLLREKAPSSNNSCFTPVRLEAIGGSLLCSTSVAQMASAALNCGPRGALALVGCSNNFLLLFDLAQPRLLQVVTQAHCGEAWALCHHPDPSMSLCATGASDGSVRFWDLRRRLGVVGRLLRFAARGIWALSFSPQGDLLAIGMDDGSLQVYAFPELQPLEVKLPAKRRGRLADERITDIKFDPSGLLLAAASMDQQVHLLRVQRPEPPKVNRGRGPGSGNTCHLTFQRSLMGNTASVMQLSFLAGAKVLMTNSADGQVMFFNPETGDRLAAAAARDADWTDPWTCPFGWPTVGVWAAKRLSSQQINSVCSVQASGSDPLLSSQGGLLASGDGKGLLSLFRFPAIEEHQASRDFRAHSAQVTSVRFTLDPEEELQVPPAKARPDDSLGNFGGLLCSLGGSDRAFLQWRVVPLSEGQSPKERRHEPWVDLQAKPNPRLRWAEQEPTPGLASSPRSIAPWASTADNFNETAPPTLLEHPGRRTLAAWPEGHSMFSSFSGTSCHFRPAATPEEPLRGRLRPRDKAQTSAPFATTLRPDDN